MFFCLRLQVETNLERFRNATSQQELVEQYQVFNSTIGDLTMKAALRQRELKDPRMRDDLASARAMLKKNSLMLLTASKVERATWFIPPPFSCPRAAHVTLQWIPVYVVIFSAVKFHFFSFRLMCATRNFQKHGKIATLSSSRSARPSRRFPVSRMERVVWMASSLTNLAT